MIIRSIATAVALTVALNAVPALADGGKFALSEKRVNGAAGGAAVGAGGTALYQYRGSIGRNLNIHRAKPGGHRIKGATRKMRPGKLKDAAGRLNRHKNLEFNKKYLKEYGEDHAKAVDKAKKDLAKKQRILKKQQKAKRIAERRRYKALKKQNPKAALALKKQRHAGKQWNAQRTAMKKRKKTLRVLGGQTKKHSRTGRRFKKTSTQLLKSKGGRKKLRNVKRLRTAKKFGKIAAGGAAGAIAGAALGEDIPDVFDAAAYSAKLVRDPRNAPKMLGNTAKGGVRMAGRMALTVTDPGKMARNLHGAAKGIGRWVANTGAYKKLARTKTGRAIGKGTRWAGRGVSKGYKTVARSRTGRAIGATARTVDRQVFKRTNNGLKTAGKGLSKGTKTLGRGAKKATRKLAKGFKKSTRKFKKTTKRTTRKVGKAARKVAKKLKFW